MAGKAPLGQAWFLSLLAHGVIGALGWAATAHWRPASPVQRVMVAKIVQLGPARAKELLPERAPAAAAPVAEAPPATAAAPAPAAKTLKRAQVRAPPPRTASRTRAALDRLKQRAQGSPQGSVEGDADEAEAGDAYLATVRQCIQSHWVIEGVDAAQVAGGRVVLLLYIQADGRITRHKLLETSGKPAFDAATNRAVQRCGQVAPPPAFLQFKLRNEGVELEFEP